MRTWKRTDGPTRAKRFLLALSALALAAGGGCAATAGDTSSAPAAKQSPDDQHEQVDTQQQQQAEARDREQAASIARCPRTARACVDKGLRISWLQDDGKVTWGPVPVLPGTPETPGASETPDGVFRVKRKDADHVSSEYNEPMPNAVFFTSNGIAFHAGALTGISHGCVHLSPDDSARYFQELPKGSQVAVF